MIGIQARELNGSGGTRTYLDRVLTALASVYDGEIVLYRPTTPEGQQFGDNVTTVPTKVKNAVLSDHISMPLFLRSSCVDVAWFPKNVIPVAYSGASVVTIHDLGYFVNSDYYPFVDRGYQKRMIRYACGKADRIIAISEHTKRDILSYTSADESKITIIYHGVDERFRYKKSDTQIREIKERFDLADTVIYGGNTGHRKNIQSMLDAFQNVQSRFTETLDLVLTGPKPRKELRRKIAETDHVRYLGYVADEDIPILYAAADLFVYPSLYEGFGLPPLEAMASGTPVIASSRASLPEVVGEAGQFVDPFDVDDITSTIELLLDDDEKRKELIQRGHQRARQFTWEKTARETVGVLVDASQ